MISVIMQAMTFPVGIPVLTVEHLGFSDQLLGVAQGLLAAGGVLGGLFKDPPAYDRPNKVRHRTDLINDSTGSQDVIFRNQCRDTGLHGRLVCPGYPIQKHQGNNEQRDSRSCSHQDGEACNDVSRRWRY